MRSIVGGALGFLAMTGVATQMPNKPSTGPRHGRTARRAIRGWVLGAVALTGFLVLAATVFGYFGRTYGVATALFALTVAVIPLGIVIPTFMWLDRFEAEPTGYLLAAFTWGALIAAPLAAVTNTTALQALTSVVSTQTAYETAAVMVAPVVEESLKGLFVLLIWLLRRHEFDGVTDGMVYAGIAAAGFAFTENIQYLASAYTAGGTELFTLTFVLRGLMSPFAHPMFTILVGVGVGVAASSRGVVPRILGPVLGLVLAVLAHSLWNFSSLLEGGSFLVLYALVDVPIFLAYIAFVVWARRREGLIIGQFLRPYADLGVLSWGEIDMLSSMSKRRQARIWARANQGRRGLAAMRSFQDTASELALLRRRIYHGAGSDGVVEQERALVSTLHRDRAAFIGGALL